jgi:hypothetical protein
MVMICGIVMNFKKYMVKNFVSLPENDTQMTHDQPVEWKWLRKATKTKTPRGFHRQG